jgi:hypothetical protein
MLLTNGLGNFPGIHFIDYYYRAGRIFSAVRECTPTIRG